MRISRDAYRSVMKAVRELDYTPNRAARELKGVKTSRVALLMRGFFREFYARAISIIHRFNIPVRGAASAHQAIAPRKEDRKNGISVRGSRIPRIGISVRA